LKKKINLGELALFDKIIREYKTVLNNGTEIIRYREIIIEKEEN